VGVHSSFVMDLGNTLIQGIWNTVDADSFEVQEHIVMLQITADG